MKRCTMINDEQQRAWLNDFDTLFREKLANTDEH